MDFSPQGSIEGHSHVVLCALPWRDLNLKAKKVTIELSSFYEYTGALKSNWKCRMNFRMYGLNCSCKIR